MSLAAGIAKIARGLSEGREPTERLDLDFSACRVRLETNSPVLVRKLARYYKDFLAAEGTPDVTVTAIEAPEPKIALPLKEKAPEPGKAKIKEEYLDLDDGRLIRKRLTGMVFLIGRGGSSHLAVGPCAANDNQIVNFINNRYIQRLLHRGCVLLHAAGTADGDRGLGLCGFSGMGKSTLALRLLDADLSYVSNDRLLAIRDGAGARMHGVPKLPRINPGTALANPRLAGILAPGRREALRTMPLEELWTLEEKYDVFIGDLYGEGRFRLSAPMKALAILNWRRDGSPLRVREVDLAARLDLFPAFTKEPGLFFEPEDGGPEASFSDEAYLAALRGVAAVEISGGVDFERAADACLELLRG